MDLLHGSTRQSLEAWGIEPGALLTLRTGGEDTLIFRIKGGSFAPSLFTPLETVELFDAGNKRRFLGVVTDPVQEGAGSEIVWRFTCKSPNYWLAGRQYGEDWQVITEAIVTEPVYSGERLTISRIGKAAANATIADAVSVVTAAGAPIALDTAHLPSVSAGEDDTTPEDLQASATCLGAIRSLLAFFPYWDWVWDYAGSEGGSATMRFFSALRPGHGIGSLPDNRWTTLTVAATAVESLSAAGLHELMISSMKINFIEPQRVQVDGLNIKCGLLTSITATRANGAFRQEEHTIFLREAYFDGADYVDAEAPMLNLARQLGAAYFYLPVVLRWRDKSGHGQPVWTHLPGRLFNVTGADAQWEEAYALCRQVTHNLHTGETSVECGPPTQLAAERLADVLRNLRNRKRPTAGDAGSQTYGFEPDPEKDVTDGTLVNVVLHQRNSTTDELTIKRAVIKATMANAIDADKKKVWTVVQDGSGMDSQKIEIIGKEIA